MLYKSILRDDIHRSVFSILNIKISFVLLLNKNKKMSKSLRTGVLLLYPGEHAIPKKYAKYVLVSRGNFHTRDLVVGFQTF